MISANADIDIRGAIDTEVDRLLAQHMFWEYCLYHDLEFFTNRPFLKQVAEGLQLVYDNYIVDIPIRIAISLPPRAGKSYITSLFCAWWMGKIPEQAVMRNTCTAKLYRKFSRDVRKIIKSRKWKSVFPGIGIQYGSDSMDGWSLTTAKQVSYFGAGVGGQIIGFGANLAITDDLYPDMEHALSDNYQETADSWKESAHDSRKERNCPEIYIGTRWTKKDVIGKAIEDGKIDIQIKIKALNENEETFCDHVKTTKEYREIKAGIDETIWAAEYDQDPIDNVGLLFPKSELQFFDPTKTDVNKLVEHKYAFIDPADEGGDDLSMPVGYLIGNKIYVTGVIYNKDGTDVNEPACVEKICNDKLDAVGIEGVSAWKLFGKAVRNKVLARHENCEIRILKENRNKATRILASSAFIKKQMFFRADWESIPEYKRFMQNMFAYKREGGNKHEDAPDSLTGIANYYKANRPELW